MYEKILIAEDEKDLGKAEKKILEINKYKVKLVQNGKEALEATKQDTYDVIILDIMMPVMNGIEALKEMRKMGMDTPIILLTAKTQIDDKVEGLDAGADDYLTKPFNMKELLARIRVFTRKNESKAHIFNVGNIIFDMEKSEISKDNTTFQLNDKESDILEILVKNQDKGISKVELGNRVWQEEKYDEANVKMYISYLQDKFSALDANVKINDSNGFIIEKL